MDVQGNVPFYSACIFLEFHAKGGQFEFSPLTERWQQGEREAEEDLRSGRFKDFASMDEMIQDLDSEE